MERYVPLDNALLLPHAAGSFDIAMSLLSTVTDALPLVDTVDVHSHTDNLDVMMVTREV